MSIVENTLLIIKSANGSATQVEFDLDAGPDGGLWVDVINRDEGQAIRLTAEQVAELVKFLTPRAERR